MMSERKYSPTAAGGGVEKTEYKTFHLDHEPTFAELWELCVNELLYNAPKHYDEIEALWKRQGITKESKIIDVAAGSGFPALGLLQRGWNIDSADGFTDEVELFNKRAEEAGLPERCAQVLWDDLLKHYPKEAYDFLLCRGNSYIYAPGGWNAEAPITPEAALDAYAKTAKDFYDLLKPGGQMYIDKFKDTETSHKETVARLQIGNATPEDLIFWTQRFSEQHIRRASMIRRKQDGTETGTPNVAYDLTYPEMEEALKTAGFSTIEPAQLSTEKVFDSWLATK